MVKGLLVTLPSPTWVKLTVRMRTDPVSAFSLAAGVLQVVDVSFRALSACREIQKNGSLAEHRDSRDLTQHLLETTRHLEKTYSNVPASALKHNNDVIDVSKKCSETAAEILTELNKLQRDPKGGFRQSFEKGILSWRKKRFLADTQDKLDRYREVLNTRILSKLDFHALQQIESYNRLDQTIKDLAVALSEGRNTYEQLLATHTTVIKEHIDRRLEDKAHEEAKLRNWQQFKDSLIYPEIFARRDDIARSHEGTCRWIFGPTQAGNEAESMRGSSNASFQRRDVEETRAQPWSNFKDWLEGDSNDPYWLSGKPGSGKSTLMKYISTELSSYCQSHDTLSAWGDAVTCSFFFWNLGSSLQKNYVGLLRSLLFQIAVQQPGMITIMSNQYHPTGSSQGGFYGSTLIYTWTEQQLDNALRRFLKNKPQSMRVCMFIDGLDEFDGDETRLIDTIHDLSHASGTKVCASSRPEQIFRLGFAASPQLKLQDLNYPDIHKATVERLVPTLKNHVCCAQRKLDSLVHDVVEKSQGIFLWADLMTKDLKRGARNADSIEELEERLERTPETIDGLYEHMLSRLDKAYLRDAGRYFHQLLAFQETFRSGLGTTSALPPTLLGFACIEEGVSSHQFHKDPGLLQFSMVQEWCYRVETRILTRCAGLVEIAEHAVDYIPYLGPGTIELAEEGVAGFVREVEFIHKSAADFVRSHEELFENSNWQSRGRFTAVRAQLPVARLAPIIISEPRSSTQDKDKDRIVVDLWFIYDLMEASCPEDGCCQATRDAAIQIVDEIYDVLCYSNTTLNGPTCTMSGRANLGFDVETDGMDDIHPFEHRLGFAAYFGRHDYVAQYMASNSFSQGDVEYVLNCAILGCGWNFGFSSTGRGLLHILLEYVPLSTDPYMMASHNFKSENIVRKSKWAAFATLSFPNFDRNMRIEVNLQYRLEWINHWKDVIKTFFVQNANADPDITLKSSAHGYFDGQELYFAFEETIIAYIGRFAAKFRCAAVRMPLTEIEDLLRAHGGTSCRKVHAVQNESSSLRVTDDQSDRVLTILPPVILKSWYLRSEFFDHVTEIAAPTQSDLVKAEEIVAQFEKSAPYGKNPLVTTG
ncbi:MAG: hypothetical protein L6R42_002358 [Xanthoria sp. 1 TBL-2021]|nr:MAG: hypothetical protein L6R42_002358 [Xanthoria sp. 1 TBL-2021]